MRLNKPGPHAAILVDAAGKPVAGAGVRLEMFAQSYERKEGVNSRIVGAGFTYFRRAVLEGSPLERLFVTKTDGHGAFSFDSLPPDAWPRLAVTTADGRHHRVKTSRAGNEPNGGMMEEMGFVPMPGGKTTSLVVYPAARVQGRVVTKLPGVSVSGLKVMYQSSRPRQDRPSHDSNFGETVITDAEGRFVFDDLNEGTINVFVMEPDENVAWTFRAAQDVELKSGWTKAVKLELIAGVEVEGTVVTSGPTGRGRRARHVRPLPAQDRRMTRGAKTDARGRYRYRLPSGETYFYVMGPPTGYTSLSGEGSSRTVTIPDGVHALRGAPDRVASAVTVRGRVVDSTGDPVANARVVGVCQGGLCKAFAGPEAVTDAQGSSGFRRPCTTRSRSARPPGSGSGWRDGSEHEASRHPGPRRNRDGQAADPGREAGPRFKGRPRSRRMSWPGSSSIRAGKPIEGVEVDAWTWYPGNETKTDARGSFRIRGLDKDRKVEVIFRKPGYTPQLFLTQPTGQPGWVVVLGNKTYFEGRVTDPEGKPGRRRPDPGQQRAEAGRRRHDHRDLDRGDDR